MKSALAQDSGLEFIPGTGLGADPASKQRVTEILARFALNGVNGSGTIGAEILYLSPRFWTFVSDWASNVMEASKNVSKIRILIVHKI